MTDLAVRTDDHFELLDIYAEDGVAPVESRIDALATISAGRKAEGKNYPERSKDGTIYVSGQGNRAPELTKILEESPKKLTIALPFNDLKQCIQQRFTRYSSSTCEVYGDKRGLTEVVRGGERAFHAAGTPKFRELLRTCKVGTSVYFALARWVGDEGAAEMYWPDGLGLYRLRTGSRNSLANLAASLELPRQFSGGRVAGLPLDLEITYRDTVDGTGKRQTVPVWALTMNPPFELTTRTFAPALLAALEAADSLHLPPPREETLNDAMLDAQFIDVDEVAPLEPTETEVRKMQHGAHNATLTEPIFRVIKDTHLGNEGVRRAWLGRISGGKYDSIKALLDEASDPIKTGAWLLDEALAEVDRKRREMERTARVAKAKIKDADLGSYGEGVTQKMVDFLQKTIKQAEGVGLRYEDRPEFLSWVAARDPKGGWIRENRDVTPADLERLRDTIYVADGDKNRPMNDRELSELVEAFGTWTTSDEGVEHLLGEPG